MRNLPGLSQRATARVLGISATNLRRDVRLIPWPLGADGMFWRAQKARDAKERQLARRAEYLAQGGRLPDAAVK